MNSLKKMIAAASMLAVTAPVLADLEANIGATSNYLWRGVSQSSDSASISGGVDYSTDVGFYAGTWVGSLGDNTGSETDFYLGFGGDFTEGVGYDVGYIYYYYSEQDGDDADFSEVYASVNASIFELGASYTVDGEASDDSQFIEGDIYVYGTVGVDLEDDFSVSATIGTYIFDADGALVEVRDDMGALLGMTRTDYDYTHYQVALTKSTEAMGDFTLAVSGTDSDTDPGSDTNIVVSWGIAL